MPPPSPPLVERLWTAALGAARPAVACTALGPGASPADFDTGAILSTSGRHRVYVADRADPARWEAAVRGAWPGAARLLDAAPPGVRRMLDTDGAFAEVYLDDLQEARPDLGLMCLVWSARSGALSRIRPVGAPPPRFVHLAPLAEQGRLAHRTGGGPPHLLWVTEARWTGRAAEAEARARALLALPPAFDALRAQVPGLYIDALDVHADGTVDLTAGVLPRG